MARSLSWLLLSTTLLLGCRGGDPNPDPGPVPASAGQTLASESTQTHETGGSTGGDAGEEETQPSEESSDAATTGGDPESEQGAPDGPPSLLTTCTSDDECARTTAWNHRGQCCSKCSRAANKTSIEARAAYCRDAERPTSCPRVRCAEPPGEARCVSGNCAIVNTAGTPGGADAPSSD